MKTRAMCYLQYQVLEVHSEVLRCFCPLLQVHRSVAAPETIIEETADDLFPETPKESAAFRTR